MIALPEYLGLFCNLFRLWWKNLLPGCCVFIFLAPGRFSFPTNINFWAKFCYEEVQFSKRVTLGPEYTYISPDIIIRHVKLLHFDLQLCSHAAAGLLAFPDSDLSQLWPFLKNKPASHAYYRQNIFLLTIPNKQRKVINHVNLSKTKPKDITNSPYRQKYCIFVFLLWLNLQMCKIFRQSVSRRQV